MVQPPTAVGGSAEKKSPVMFELPKVAVPVGTVAGFQLLAALYSPVEGAKFQIASWA